MSGDAGATWSYITSIITDNAQYLDYVDFYAHNDMYAMVAALIIEQRS